MPQGKERHTALHHEVDELGLPCLRDGHDHPALRLAEEKSINYELGLRFSGDRTYVDTALFFTDYNNLLGHCTGIFKGYDKTGVVPDKIGHSAGTFEAYDW
jgi:hypothetical protein